MSNGGIPIPVACGRAKAVAEAERRTTEDREWWFELLLNLEVVVMVIITEKWSWIVRRF